LPCLFKASFDPCAKKWPVCPKLEVLTFIGFKNGGRRESQEEIKRLRDENESLKSRLREFEASARKRTIFSELSATKSTTPPKKILGKIRPR
jgi:hypothetical protein